jgi:hypothetical protein
VDSCESCIAAAGCVDVRLGTLREFFEATKDVVADTSGGMSAWCGGVLDSSGDLP